MKTNDVPRLLALTMSSEVGGKAGAFGRTIIVVERGAEQGCSPSSQLFFLSVSPRYLCARVT